MYEINKMPSAIDIGFTGEKLFREIQIDMTKWMQQMPDGVPSIVHIRPGETEADAYIAATTFEDNILTWKITNGDLGEIEGTGLMQIWLEEEENSSVVKRGKSILVVTRISKAINEADGTTPAAQEAWLEQMTALKVATVNAAEDADDAKDDAVAAKTAAETAQGKAEDSAEDAEAYAIGKRNGTDVGSSDPAYHNNSKYYAGEAGTAKTDAKAAQAAAEAAVAHYPYVDTTTGNWMCWDASTGQWVNTGVHAKGDTGTVPDIEVGTVTTLLPGESATVTRRSGSPDTAPIFDFGIPKGDTGQAENIYGNTIEMSEDDSTKVATEIGKKANKVTSATSGHFAGLDSNGDLVDSGKQASDFATYETTLRFVPFSILTTDWTLSSGVYKVEYTTAYATSTCKFTVEYGNNYRNATDDIDTSVKSGGGAIVFETASVPSGTLSGVIWVFDPDDGKIPVIMEDTVVAVANGGTGASNASGARTNLGLGDSAVCAVANNLTETAAGKVLDARQGKALSDQIGTLNGNMPKTVSLSTPSAVNNTDGYAYWPISSLNVSDISKIKNITATIKVSGNATRNHGVGWDNNYFFIFVEKGGSISRNDVTAEATIFFA